MQVWMYRCVRRRFASSTSRSSLTNAGGAGALRSSAMDLAKWMQALTSGRVVDARSWQEMTTPARLSDGCPASANRVNVAPSDPAGDYAFGVRITDFDGHRRIGHDGDTPGFEASLYTYPDDRITISWRGGDTFVEDIPFL